jgi:hypothetical protein
LWLLKIVYMNQDGGQQNLQVSNWIQRLVKPSLGETNFWRITYWAKASTNNMMDQNHMCPFPIQIGVSYIVVH